MANPGPVAAIRQFCLECQGNSSRSVRQCADEDCPLWGWRMAAIEADSLGDWTREFYERHGRGNW